jgi:hypothetical protein
MVEVPDKVFDELFPDWGKPVPVLAAPKDEAAAVKPSIGLTEDIFQSDARDQVLAASKDEAAAVKLSTGLTEDIFRSDARDQVVDRDGSGALSVAISTVQQAICYTGMESEWTSILAATFAELPTPVPERLTSVLADHGWRGTQFQAPPSRQALLEDLLSLNKAVDATTLDDSLWSRSWQLAEESDLLRELAADVEACSSTLSGRRALSGWRAGCEDTRAVAAATPRSLEAAFPPQLPFPSRQRQSGAPMQLGPHWSGKHSQVPKNTQDEIDDIFAMFM